MDEDLKHKQMTSSINRKNMLLFSLLMLSIGLFHFSTAIGQSLDESKYKDVYRLSGNYSPVVLDCYAVEKDNGITQIYNENTGKFYPEKYQISGIDNTF